MADLDNGGMAERGSRSRAGSSRLAHSASFATTLNARFGDTDLDRRRVAMTRIREDPALAVGLSAPLAGPDALPAECFTEDLFKKVFDTTLGMIA